MSKTIRALALAAACLCASMALRAQATGPVAPYSVSSNPATCGVNEMYLNTSTSPGTWYQCTSTNTWSQLSGGGVTSISTACGVAGGPITTTGSIYGWETENAQTGTSYTLVGADCGMLVSLANSSAVALTSLSATLLGNGWHADLVNLGPGTVTFTPGSGTVNGNATQVLTTGQGGHLESNGTNFRMVLGVGSATSGTISTILGGTGVSVTGGTGPSAIVSVTAPTVVIVNAQNQQYNQCPLTSSSTATVTCTMNGTLAAYANGSSGTTMVSIIANYTSISTLTVNGLLDGASNAPKVYDSGGTVNPVASVIGLNYNFQWNSTFNSGAGGWQQIGAKGNYGGTRPRPLFTGGGNANSSDGNWGGWSYFGTIGDVATPANTVNSINYPLWGLILNDSNNPVIYYQDVLPDDFSGSMVVYFGLGDKSAIGSGVFQVKMAVACWALNAIPPATSSISSFPNSTGALTLTSSWAFAALSINTSSCTAGQNIIYALQRDNTVGSNLAGPMFFSSPVMKYSASY